MKKTGPRIWKLASRFLGISWAIWDIMILDLLMKIFCLCRTVFRNLLSICDRVFMPKIFITDVWQGSKCTFVWYDLHWNSSDKPYCPKPIFWTYCSKYRPAETWRGLLNSIFHEFKQWKGKKVKLKLQTSWKFWKDYYYL